MFNAFPPQVLTAFEEIHQIAEVGGPASDNLIDAPLPPTQQIALGGVAPYLVRQKDQNSEKRQAKAQELATSMAQQFEQIFLNNNAASPRTEELDIPKLYIRICIASEGSRKARIWAAELGYGHAKLMVEWILHGRGHVWRNGCSYYTDDGGDGFVDLCCSTVGDVALEKMKDEYVNNMVRLLKIDNKNNKDKNNGTKRKQAK